MAKRNGFAAVDRRQLILEAAKDCFEEKGYKETSIKDISTRAGVSVGTIYSYYKNKKDLFEQLNIPEAENKRPVFDEKKQEIIHATLRLINLNSFDKVTMESIAAYLGYSKAYIYQFFDSKEDLFTQIIQSSVFNIFIQDVNDYPEKYTVEEVVESIGKRYLQIYEDHDRCALMKIAINYSSTNPEFARIYYKNAVIDPCETIVSFMEWHNQKKKKKNENFNSDTLRLFVRTYIGSLQSYVLMNNITDSPELFRDGDEYARVTSNVFLTYLKENGYY